MQSAFNSSVFAKVALAVERTGHAETSGLSQSTRLVDDLAFGWLGSLKLAMSLQEVFDLKLEDDVFGQFVDLGDVVRYFSHRYFRDTEPSTLTMAT